MVAAGHWGTALQRPHLRLSDSTESVDLFLECPDPRVGFRGSEMRRTDPPFFLTQGDAPRGLTALRRGRAIFPRPPRSVLNPGDVLADMKGPRFSWRMPSSLAAAGFRRSSGFTFDFSERFVPLPSRRGPA